MLLVVCDALCVFVPVQFCAIVCNCIQLCAIEVTAVFKSFETGLREATIHPKVKHMVIITSTSSSSPHSYDVQQDLHKAMQRLGLNPTEQEVVDIPNEIAR